MIIGDRMLGVTELASILSLSRPAVHNILSKCDVGTASANTRQKKLSSNDVAKILSMRKLAYPNTKATFGIEKGGNGKSALTLMTALAAARRGCSVVVIDTDPEGCCTQFLMTDDFDLKNSKTVYEVFKENIPIREAIVPSRFDGVKFLPARAHIRRTEKLIEGENPKKLLAEKLVGIEDEGTLVFFDVPPIPLYCG